MKTGWKGAGKVRDRQGTRKGNGKGNNGQQQGKQSLNSSSSTCLEILTITY
jgi:hypothetical protein